MSGRDDPQLRRLAATVQIDIRRCDAADLPLLEWWGAFSHHREIFAEAFQLQQAGEAVMLVAAARDFPVGQAWLDLRPRGGARRAMVWAVRVLPPFQGVGLGAALMAALEREALVLGHRRLEVGVEKANPQARAFYERLGWRIERERRDSYSYTPPGGELVVQPLDEWVMVKELDQEAGGESPTLA